MRRVLAAAVLGALVATVSGTAVGTATGTAQAADPQPFPLLLVNGADTASGASGVLAAAPTGTGSTLVAGTATRTGFSALSASRGGDRFVTRGFSPSADTVVVRDISGALVGTPDSLAPANGPFAADASFTQLRDRPALSPDGGTVAWLRQSWTRCNTLARSELRIGPAGGAGAKVVASEAGGSEGVGISEVTYVDDDLMVIGVGTQDFNIDDVCAVPPAADGFRTVTRDGAVATVTGLRRSGSDPVTTYDSLAFSPDGTRVAYVRSVSNGFGSSPVAVETAPVTRTGNALAIGAPVDLGAGRSPSFSGDDSTVLLVRDGRLVTVPALGGAAVPTGPSTLAASDAAYATGETLAPAAPLSVTPGARTGSTVAVGFTLASDPTASRVRVTRTTAGLAPLVREAVLPATSVTVPGLVSGRPYFLDVQVVDRSGNVGPAAKVTLKPTAPTSAVRFPGQDLVAGTQLRADTGHRLRVGTDGNVVAYAPNGAVLFQTRTRGTGAGLRVGGDGNLVLRDGRGRVLWQARTAGQGSAILVVQRDGNVVLYRDSDGRAVWSSNRGRLY